MSLPPTELTARADGSIAVAGPPSIPRLRFRAYSGADDLPGIVGVVNAANAADGSPETWSQASMRVELENPTHVDPRQDHVIAEVDGEVVAYSEIEWSDATDGARHYRSRGYVRPDWRRRGLGGAMLRRNEARLTEIAAAHSVTMPRLLVTGMAESDVGAAALFEASGYRRARVFHHMTRPDMADILLPSLPAGIEIQPLTRAQLPHLWEAIVEAFQDHPGAMDDSVEAYRRWAGDPVLDVDLSVIAWEGDQIAGGVMGYIDDVENEAHDYRRGWTDPVFVRRPWRRRGLASALLGRCLALLRDRGMTSAQLDVDSDNPNQALGLYRRHRFAVDHTGYEWHKPLDG